MKGFVVSINGRSIVLKALHDPLQFIQMYPLCMYYNSKDTSCFVWLGRFFVHTWSFTTLISIETCFHDFIHNGWGSSVRYQRYICLVQCTCRVDTTNSMYIHVIYRCFLFRFYIHEQEHSGPPDWCPGNHPGKSWTNHWGRWSHTVTGENWWYN